MTTPDPSLLQSKEEAPRPQPERFIWRAVDDVRSRGGPTPSDAAIRAALKDSPFARDEQLFDFARGWDAGSEARDDK